MEKQLVLLCQQQKRKFFTSCFGISERTHQKIISLLFNFRLAAAEGSGEEPRRN
jgi:hypothetical protein